MVRLTAADLTIAIDALAGSLSIIDRGTVFQFDHDTRQTALDRIIEVLKQMELSISPDENASERVPK